jgi:hypothetical protein
MPNTPRDTESRYQAKIKLHNRAFAHPFPGFEDALAHLVRGLVAYREVYAARYKVEISVDPCLADNWLGIAKGVLGLLDGDTGRLDCPTLDGLIRLTAEQAGFTLALEESPGANL